MTTKQFEFGIAVRHIAILQVNLEIRQNKTKAVKEVMMNLAPAYEQWLHTNREEARQEGRQEGIQAGRQESQQEIACRMLSRNIPLTEIAEITGLPIATLQSLTTQST
jgi:predicted transposase/invertase (TIGR01784 family)